MDKGTNDDEMPGCSSWYFVDEAECSDKDGEDEYEQLFDEETQSNVSELIDDSLLEQGNSLALFQSQHASECEEQLARLKRKFLPSPVREEIDSLSPRLEKVSLSPVKTKKKAKKSLFRGEDSGIASSHEASCVDGEPAKVQSAPDEVDRAMEEDNEGSMLNSQQASQVDEDDIDSQELQNVLSEEPLTVTRILKTANRRAFLLKTFKCTTGISFNEITREFKSDKTCSDSWVIALFAVSEEVAESANVSLKTHCDFFYIKHLHHFAIMLVEFKAGKSRETVMKLFKTLFGSKEEQILANPPRTRSVPCALYWYQRIMSRFGYNHGEIPSWIHKQTLISHVQSEDRPFELSQMVQWALDNNFVEEHEIAFEYATIGREDHNAAAFLKSNSQPKHVRDCSIMVKHYLRAQMQKMTMAEYIHERCMECPGEEDPNLWREIVKFLRYQRVEFIPFLCALKYFFKKVPKKQCLVLTGPSNTGKSYFATSLIEFLKGRVISFANASSHFWIQPLGDAKIGLLDDATHPCWRYLDINMRNALDGNPFSLDCKHRSLVQMRLPPLLITSNIDVSKDDEFRYLATRLKIFCFERPFPFNSQGAAVFRLDKQSWRSFFRRFWIELDFPVQEDNPEDGEGFEPPLKFYTKSDS